MFYLSLMNKIRFFFKSPIEPVLTSMSFEYSFLNHNLSLIQTISAAYKHADGKKIDGKRVLVDVERARTVKGWLPRRLGKLLVRILRISVT